MRINEAGYPNVDQIANETVSKSAERSHDERAAERMVEVRSERADVYGI